MALDVDELLTIDVEAELRKLSAAQFEGPWQIPAELVRSAIRRGASRVEVRTTRRGFSVVDDGQPLGSAAMCNVSVLIDTSAPTHKRHQALGDLERDGYVGLIGVVGSDARSLRIESSGPSSGARLEARENTAKLSSLPGSGRSNATTMEVRSPNFDRRKVKHWLHAVAGFTRHRVLLDGELIQRGYSVIATRPLVHPLRGTIAIDRAKSGGLVWLLNDGIATAHLTIPRSFGFVGVVEQDSTGWDQSAARARAQFSPHATALIDQVVDLLAQTLLRTQTLSPTDHTRCREHLLKAIRERPKDDRLREIKCIPAWVGDELRMTSVSDLKAMATRRADRTLPVIAPTESRLNLVRDEPIFVLSEAERTLINDICAVHWRPPRQAATTTAYERARATLRRTREHFTRLIHGLKPLRGRPVADDALSREEHHALVALRDASGLGDALSMCAGRGPVVLHHATRTILLPRRNRWVASAVESIARNPALARMSAWALLPNGPENSPSK